jgi:hypothetical protein
MALAQSDPVAFQLFRQTGLLPFVATFHHLDQRFPGHYLRLIRGVKVSVIALIPPGIGIRATLSSLGTSRVVLGDGRFDVGTIRRAPESVALTSPLGATGLFELDAQPELMVPFESMGFDTAWELRMPRAANRRAAVRPRGPRRPPVRAGATAGRTDDSLAAAVVIGRRTCSCCRGERADPGRGADCRAAARGSTTAPGCRRWHRASRGPVAAVPR